MTQTAEPSMEATRDAILNAAKAISGVCDGAQIQDGSGFNAVDSPTAKSILSTPSPTDRQIRCLWNMLRKYRLQLRGFGVEYEALVPPALPPRAEDGRFIAEGCRVKFEWVETRNGRRIAIVFAYNPTVIDAVKRTERSYFDKGRQCWILPDDPDRMEDALGELETVDPPVKVDIEPALRERQEQVREDRRRSYESSRAETSDIVVNTKLELRPFQRAGVQWTLEHEGRALIGDDMGLGKTCQALGFLTLSPQTLPALVICPATIRVKWAREVAKFTDFKPQIVCGKTALPSLRKLGVDADLVPNADADIVILNYDLLEAQTPETWVKKILKGNKTVEPLLVEAGQYAMKALGKGLKKATLWSQPVITRIMKTIGQQGRKANKKRFVKIFLNRTPMEEFLSRGFSTIICDESHYLKDHGAQRTMAAMEMGKRFKNVICMTGTPILNRPKEAWSQVSIINPTIFPNFFEYAKRYCGGFEGQFGWDFSGASNLDELEQILRSRVLIRRLKRQVLKELPAKTRVTIPIVLEEKLKKYEKEVKPALERLAKLRQERENLELELRGLDEEGRRLYFAEHAEARAKSARLTGAIIEEIDGVKKAAVHAKFNECLRFILDVHEQQGKVIVFMHHHETIDRMVEALKKEGKKIGQIDGRIPTAKRDPIRDEFQDGDTDFLVLGIRAASEGLDLTASHTVVFVEFDWNPGRHQQAEDRVDRMGQTVPPTVYYLVALGTVEEKVVSNIDAKREVVNAALGEGERTVQEKGIMDAILDDLLGSRK